MTNDLKQENDHYYLTTIQGTRSFLCLSFLSSFVHAAAADHQVDILLILLECSGLAGWLQSLCRA
jgi:hypothetical protein